MSLNNDEFIKKSKLIHNDKYIYSKIEYKTSHIKVIIICKEHGEFEQTPGSHLAGNGCPKCGSIQMAQKQASNTGEFILKSKLKHGNNYDYSKVQYTKANKKVIIICKKHGEFKLTPNSHLRGSGCSKCYSKYSKAQIQWLEFLEKYYNINIQHFMNEGEFIIPTTLYKADGYCKETNTIYEFNGDYFHGNPKIFKPEEINKLCKATHGELYQKTLEKENKIKELGYNLEVMWESDWNNINKSISILQKKFKSIKLENSQSLD